MTRARGARPPHLALAALPTFAALLALGFWQLERLDWKTALIANRAAALARPPVAAPSDDARFAAFDYRRVTLEGRLDHGRELHLAAISARGDGGYRVLTPLIREGAASAVLVNRGWVPYARKDPASRPEHRPEGRLVLEGVAVRPRTKGLFDAKNDPAANTWYWPDLAAMADVTGLKLAPVIVNAIPAAGAAGYPRAEPSRVRLANDHLGYAITWFALAAGLALVYLLAVRSNSKRRS